MRTMPPGMSKRSSMRLIGSGAIALLAAVLLQWRPGTAPLPGKGVHLGRVLPENITEWRSSPLRLGATEASSDQVEKVLRFDDAFYRNFQRADGANLTLYVAYWDPGKMPVQLVASHVPDRCWTSVGWICTAQEYHCVLSAGTRILRPGQGRTFRHQGQPPQYVVYWLLVGDKLFDFGERFNRVPSPWRWWREVLRDATGRPQGQYFIRLTSDRPFEELKEDRGFEQVLTALTRLGLGGRA